MGFLECILIFLLIGYARADLAKDRAECGNQVVGLATCLPFVSGQSKAPTSDCCSGFKQVLQKTPQCICILIKDRNDPTLGLKINATLALSLPNLCHTPGDISECPALLHLAPNSPEAKIFQEFANSGKKGNNSTAAAATMGNPSSKGTSADLNSDGGKKNRWVGIEMASVLLWLFLTY